MTEQYYYKSTTEREFDCVKDDERLIETLSDKGYTVYAIAQKSNQLIPYHEHPSEEMVIVLSGKVRYIVEEEIVDLEEGDIIRVRPHSVHSMIGIYESGVSNLLLVFI